MTKSEQNNNENRDNEENNSRNIFESNNAIKTVVNDTK